jgi:orotate phosphoribosyltransferase
MHTAERLAHHLLQSKSIIIDPANPFTWASGWKSPIYCDNRKTLSYPEIRTFIRDEFVALIRREFNPVDMIAGVATGAIAQGALVAESMGLPFLYVRSSRKAHGTGSQIEGDLGTGRSVVIIEDLVSTGKSSLEAASALKEAGLKVLGMAAIFTYGFPQAEANFNDAGITLYTLGNYQELLTAANASGYISAEQMDTLAAWRKDPANWDPEVPEP